MVGQAYCWGSNVSGQLGNGLSGAENNSLVPVAVTVTGALAGKTISQISAGTNHTCVIASDNQAYCWGLGASGQLGNNSVAGSLAPVAVTTTGVLAGKTIAKIDAGGSHTCVIASDNQAYCWGLGTSGQLGRNLNLTNSSVPVAVTTTGVLAGKTILQVSSGNTHTCAIASDGQAYCWGTGTNGRLGNGLTTATNSAPLAVVATGVLSGKTILQIDAGNIHTCVIASDNQAYCWGGNGGGTGQLGNGSAVDSSVPVAVATTGVLTGKTISQISAGNSSTCAVASDGQAYCWGYGSFGQLGTGSSSSSSVPVAVYTGGVLSGKTISQISTTAHSCATSTDGGAYCWSFGESGQLGDSTNPVASNSPVAVSNVNVAAVSGPSIPSSRAYKLQYAKKTAATCALQTGFTDITTSSPIRWKTNPGVTNGVNLTGHANDPVTAYPYVYQHYSSAFGFYANFAIPAGSAGLWDFSLSNFAGDASSNYCFQAVPTAGAAFAAYNNYPEIVTAAGQLSLVILDDANNILPILTTPFTSAVASTQSARTTHGAFVGGGTNQKIRVINTTSSPAWNLSIAATGGTNGKWDKSDLSASYSYNNRSGVGFRNGQLYVDPTAQSFAPRSGCTTTGVNRGSDEFFQFGSVEAITLTGAIASASTNCYWDIQDIDLTQTVPAMTPPGSYAIDMTLTLVAQ